MAEHAGETSDGAADKTPRASKGAEVDWRRVRGQSLGLLAGIVRWAGLIVAAVLVLQVFFVVGSANPANTIVSWVRGWADIFALGFQDLFEPSDAKLRVLVNFGLAALFWLIVSGIVARIIRRLGGDDS